MDPSAQQVTFNLGDMTFEFKLKNEVSAQAPSSYSLNDTQKYGLEISQFESGPIITAVIDGKRVLDERNLIVTSVGTQYVDDGSKTNPIDTTLSYGDEELGTINFYFIKTWE